MHLWIHELCDDLLSIDWVARIVSTACRGVTGILPQGARPQVIGRLHRCFRPLTRHRLEQPVLPTTIACLMSLNSPEIRQFVATPPTV